MAEIIGLVLLILAFPVISVIALVKALNTRDSVRRLELRIAVLEAGPARRPGEATAPEPVPPVAVEQPTIAEPVAAPETPEPAAAPVAPAPASTTLEERFGTQWVVWI
ncbi:MAG TPA: hypothetical protein VFL49_08320, partial [Pseudolabrys sp.]|nr:hypothetical protein [Pseudolabrys sp.]